MKAGAPGERGKDMESEERIERKTPKGESKEGWKERCVIGSM